jgi:hypothetical protein
LFESFLNHKDALRKDHEGGLGKKWAAVSYDEDTDKVRVKTA